jgi:hypothetical protein
LIDRGGELGLRPKPHQRDFFEKKSLWKPQKTEIKNRLAGSGAVLFCMDRAQNPFGAPTPKDCKKKVS